MTAEPRKPAKLPSAAATTSPLRFRSFCFDGAARRPLAGECSSTCKRSDQRHLASVIFNEPQRARQWLPGHFGNVHAEMLGEFGGQRDEAQLLVRDPFIVRISRIGFGRAAKQRG